MSLILQKSKRRLDYSETYAKAWKRAQAKNREGDHWKRRSLDNDSAEIWSWIREKAHTVKENVQNWASAKRRGNYWEILKRFWLPSQGKSCVVAWKKRNWNLKKI